MPGTSPNTEWWAWQDRILNLLEVSQGQLLRGYSLPRPWFLVPRGGELAEEEAEALFAVVRERLLGPEASAPGVAEVRRRIGGVRAGESLPLLYAMRHVARFRGRTALYWPAFRQDILANRLELTEVQMRLAGALADVWLRTHEYTKGALYFPREGLINIKWPLAHAGLLKADEELLESFGVILAAEGGDESAAAPLGPEDLDEFLGSVLRWLRQGGHRHDARLARVLSQTDGTQRTIAELAQRWLQDNWARVLNTRRHRASHAPSSRGASWEAATTVRAFLRYDAAQNRLHAVLPAGVWPGKVEAKVLWGDQEINLPPRYVHTKAETRFDEVNLPVDAKAPGDEAWLMVGGERRALRVPPLPEDRGLVFEMGDGKVTNRWRTGEAYHVLMLEGDVDGEAATEIFDDWADLGPPECIEGRPIIWARTRDPLSEGGGAALDVGVLELAAETLGLPGLEDLWRPRVRLVGGSSVVGGRGEVFARDGLPLIEVRGLWEGALPVRLARWDAGREEYVTEADLQLPEPRSGAARLVEVSVRENRAPVEKYLIEVGRFFRDCFEVGEPPALPEPDRFEVALGARAGDDAPFAERLTRHELESATLVGRAWPGAQMALRASVGGAWSRTVRALADESGEWRACWRDLGLGVPAAGPIEVLLSWRDLAKARITAADAPYVVADSLDLYSRGQGPDEERLVSALVAGTGQHHRAEVVLVGSRPWDNQLWTEIVDLDEDGGFGVGVRVGEGKPEWLLVLPEADGNGASEPPWLVHRLPRSEEHAPRIRLRPGQYAMESLRGQSRSRWHGVASRLRGASFLLEELSRKLAISALADYALNSPSLRPGQPRWTEVAGTRDLGLLLPDGPGPGEAAFVAVFYRVQPGLAGYTGTLRPPYLIAPADALAAATRSRSGTVDLSYVTPGGPPRKLPSVLETAKDLTGLPFVLRANEELRACPDCGVILPAGDAWGHQSPRADVPCSSRGKKNVMLYQSTTKPVHLIARRDPGDVFARTQGYLRDVAAGSERDDIPSHAHPWLDEIVQVYDDEGTDQELTDWLLGLVVLPRKIATVRLRIEGGGRMEENNLVELSRQVRRYRPALDLLYRWLQSEMG